MKLNVFGNLRSWNFLIFNLFQSKLFLKLHIHHSRDNFYAIICNLRNLFIKFQDHSYFDAPWISSRIHICDWGKASHGQASVHFFILIPVQFFLKSVHTRWIFQKFSVVCLTFNLSTMTLCAKLICKEKSEQNRTQNLMASLTHINHPWEAHDD